MSPLGAVLVKTKIMNRFLILFFLAIFFYNGFYHTARNASVIQELTDPIPQQPDENQMKFIEDLKSPLWTYITSHNSDYVNLNCGVSPVTAPYEGNIKCPRCKDKKPSEILHASLAQMEKGMHDASSDAELISSLYMPQPQNYIVGDDYSLGGWVYKGNYIEVTIPKSKGYSCLVFEE